MEITHMVVNTKGPNAKKVFKMTVDRSSNSRIWMGLLVTGETGISGQLQTELDILHVLYFYIQRQQKGRRCLEFSLKRRKSGRLQITSTPCRGA
jgi:hypothetical protein